MTTLSMHQPGYFPWLGLLDKLWRSDVFLIMDEVQLSDDAFQHRNLFLTADGKAKYLTIPFIKKDYLKKSFRDIEIADPDWRSNHFNFLWNSYRKHPFANEIMPRVEKFYADEYERLIDAVVASMRLSFELFGLGAALVFQSEIQYDRSLRRGELVVALARAVGASCYLSGSGAKAYLDESAFGAGLQLRFNRFEHPVYAQRGASVFQPGLACLDVLFNLGTAGARELLATRATGD